MSRIAPLEPPYAPEIQEQFDRTMRGAPPLMLFRVVASQARAWEKFRAGSLLDRGPLSLREREIVIDRTCALTRCEYEWGVHVAAFAAAAHLTDEQVRATVLGKADAACWSAAEQALIAAVDLRYPSPQYVVQMHDADRPVGVGHDQGGDLRRVENFQRFAGEQVARNGLRILRHYVVDQRRHQIGAHVAAQIAVGDDADDCSAPIDEADAPKTFPYK